MQQSWRTDGDKLTFIVCMPAIGYDVAAQVQAEKDDAPERMVGDVNLFLTADDDELGDDQTDEQCLIGEVEIMIARKDLHRKGYGRATLLTFLWYVFMNVEIMLQEFVKDSSRTAVQRARLKYLGVKIGATNERSLRLFKSVGFRNISEEPNYFGELEMRLEITDALEQLKVEKQFELPRVLKYSLLS